MKTQLNVSQHSGASYLIIGSGRLATHLLHYFKLLNVKCQTWKRSENLSELQTRLQSKPIVLLAISDSSIESFYNEHLKTSKVVQFSGALHVPGMISCHPLMTFGHELYDLATYKKIHFAVTGVQSLQDVLPELSNHSFALSAEQKPLYHALCVLSAAGAQTLWKISEKHLTDLNVPTEAFRNYIQQTALNYKQNGAAALTGPWVRKDSATIQKNNEALEKINLQEVYQLLRKEFL